MTWESRELRAELDRVGVTYAKAGAADFIWATDFGEFVSLLGPPREHPRRSWRGPERQLLSLLTRLSDDAGGEAVWSALR